MNAVCSPQFVSVLDGLDVAAMDRHTGSVYGLWPDLSLAYLNPAWFRFSAENHGEPAISCRWSLGAPLMAAIPDPLQTFYTDLFTTALAQIPIPTARPLQHEYECSSASLYRRFLMTLYPLKSGAGLLIVNTLVTERNHDADSRPPQPANEALYVDQDGIMRQCAHCRRIQVTGNADLWHWVPAWVEHCPPSTSHTLCTFCLDYYYPPDDS
jgi:hypothetical protein